MTVESRFKDYEQEDTVWHDFDPDEETAVCGEVLPEQPAFAVAEVDPRPRCADCEDSS